MRISEFYHTWAVYSQYEEHYFTLKLQFSILILKWWPKLHIIHSPCEWKGQIERKTNSRQRNYNKIAISCLPKPQRQMEAYPQPPLSYQCLEESTQMCGWHWTRTTVRQRGTRYKTLQRGQWIKFSGWALTLLSEYLALSRNTNNNQRLLNGKQIAAKPS